MKQPTKGTTYRSVNNGLVIHRKPKGHIYFTIGLMAFAGLLLIVLS